MQRLGSSGSSHNDISVGSGLLHQLHAVISVWKIADDLSLGNMILKPDFKEVFQLLNGFSAKSL